MALITIADSFSVKIANTAQPAIAGDPEGIQKGATGQSGLFVWVTDNVDVLGRALADTEWTVIENLGATNKEAIIRWEDYDVVAFQSQAGNPTSVRIIPKYGSLIRTTSNPIEVPRINKFSDLTDVPAYTAADEGKVFKVSGGGNLTLELPPNLNTQTSTFPHIGQMLEDFNVSTAISNTRLGNTSLATGLIAANLEETGTLNTSGVERDTISDAPNVLMPNTLIRNSSGMGTLAASRGGSTTGHGLAFETNEDYVFGTNDFTISFWAKLPTGGSPYIFQTPAWSIGGGSRQTTYMEIRYLDDTVNAYSTTDTGGGPVVYTPGCMTWRAWGFVSGKFRITGYGGFWVNTDATNYCDGQYHLFTFVRSGDDFSIYVDGTLNATKTYPNVNLSHANNNQVFTMGGNYQSVGSGGTTLVPASEGTHIEQYCIWSRALTLGEIGLLYNNLSADGPWNSAAVADGTFEISIEGDNFESSSKIYIYHEDGTVHDYENRATADFSMDGDYTGHASLKTSTDNITILETNNQILLSEFVEDANEFSGKIPFVFINKNKMRIRITPQTAGTYSMVVWNADGNKCVLKNCITLT